ncbi:hypothetical protein AB0283_16485 [Micromonospora vinacea]|uniref:hypothetical protein n=1 Tax=Micromonospora vinacea TaxID=709878 RepID=UPI00344C65D4
MATREPQMKAMRDIPGRLREAAERLLAERPASRISLRDIVRAWVLPTFPLFAAGGMQRGRQILQNTLTTPPPGPFGAMLADDVEPDRLVVWIIGGRRPSAALVVVDHGLRSR